MYICLSIYLSLSFYLSIYISLYFYLSIYLYLSICIYVYLSVYSIISLFFLWIPYLKIISKYLRIRKKTAYILFPYGFISHFLKDFDLTNMFNEALLLLCKGTNVTLSKEKKGIQIQKKRKQEQK